MADLLYGRNAVREVLRAQRRRGIRLQVAAGVQTNEALREIIERAEQANLPIEYLERSRLDQIARTSHHQGVALQASTYPYVDIDEMLQLAGQQQEPPFLLLLDHLQDPQNVGSLLRTAEAVGIHGVVLPERRAAGITPAVVNASSGATEHLLIGSVTNLARTIKALQQANVWIAGLENDPTAQPLEQADLQGGLALVVGAEGSGLARLTRERCDFLVRLPTRGRLESLNAAVAGSIALYAAWRQREQPHR